MSFVIDKQTNKTPDVVFFLQFGCSAERFSTIF